MQKSAPKKRSISAMREEIRTKDKRIVLVGTAHISRESAIEVERVIRDEQPDTVCVELCDNRYKAMRDGENWRNMDIVKVIRQGKAPLLLANLIVSAYQKKMGEKLGIAPGAEMLKAIQVAEEIGSETLLADRDVTITLKRTWGKLSILEKFKLFGQLLYGIFEPPDISEEEIEKLKEKDMLTEAIEKLSKTMPSVKSVLIDERDRYLATKIAQAEGSSIVAIVGAGHLSGIQHHIEKPVRLADLEVLPKPGNTGKILKWAIPCVMLAIIAYGFLGIDLQVGLEMAKYWILINGVLAALGAAIAGGHIVTVVSAFIAAPLTSLNPTIAAGWVSGLTEAWVRKPRVEDFENLSRDITTVKGFRKNEITKILLVVMLSNIGSMIGTFIGIPVLTSML